MTFSVSILILEDMVERIDWLKKHFGDTVNVTWVTTVKQFKETLPTMRPQPDLIILDHDLGADAPGASGIISTELSWPMDRHGNNGMHAVDDLINLHHDGKSIPRVIVWSANVVEAPKMVARLNQYTETWWVPFTNMNVLKEHLELQYKDIFKYRFLTLKELWDEEIQFESSATKIVEHPFYREIIEMGVNVIPHILQEMKEGHGHWSYAMRMLTGCTPRGLEAAGGDIKRQNEIWLEWAKTKEDHLT